MDKGKGVASEWTSSGSDGSDRDRDCEHILRLLKKQRREFDEIIDEITREKDYWKDAYVQEHRRYQRFSSWARDQMDVMTFRHRGQHRTFQDMAEQNKRVFGDIKKDLATRVDEAFRQAMDSMNAMEWMAHDHMRKEVVPRYQEPWIPSMFGEKRVRFMDGESRLPRAPTPPPTVGLGAGPSAAPPRVRRRVRMTARMSVRPSPPRVGDDEAAIAWVDRMLDEAGRSTVSSSKDGDPGPETGRDGESEDDPEQEPEEDADEESDD